MATRTLNDLAKTIRSKNAGTDRITFDIIFSTRENYELVRDSQLISRETISSLFNIDEGRISDFVTFDPANAIKFTIQRPMPSGSPGESDIFGCQQYPPLLDIQIPVS
jgi:hypothetical protein